MNDAGAVCAAAKLTPEGSTPCGAPAPEHGLTVEQVTDAGVTRVRLPVCDEHYRALKESMFTDTPDGERREV